RRFESPPLRFLERRGQITPGDGEAAALLVVERVQRPESGVTDLGVGHDTPPSRPVRYAISSPMWRRMRASSRGLGFPTIASRTRSRRSSSLTVTPSAV